MLIVIIGGLLFSPTFTLNAFWNVVLPCLPLSFLVASSLWRSVCPLSYLNMISSGKQGERVLRAKYIPRANAISVSLLFLLVPTRRFLFNENGIALAMLLLSIGVLAAYYGSFFIAKAGFCNSICPVLPVEKLYGQHPLIELKSSKCPSCTICTAKGCVDLSPQKAIRSATSKKPGSQDGWITTAFGVFAASFPGFIWGFYTIGNITWIEAGAVYLHIGVFSLISYLLVFTATRFFQWPARYVLPILAAASILCYYWFAIPQMLQFFGISSNLNVSVFRSVIYAVIGLWLARAVYQSKAFVATTKKIGLANQQRAIKSKIFDF